MAAHRIFLHLTWSTYRRQPMIDAATHDFLMGYFRKIANQERVTIIALTMVRTHVHLLLRSNPRIDMPRLVQFLKGGSSHAANREPNNVLGLRWNPEYSVTSVSPRLVKAAVEYIQNQDRRHPDERIVRRPALQGQ